MNAPLPGNSEYEIVFVTNMIAVGGAERVLCLLANEFSRRGYRVLVMSFLHHPQEYDLDAGVTVYYGPNRHSDILLKLGRALWIRGVARRNPSAVFVSFQYFVNIVTAAGCVGLSNAVVLSERNDPARVGNGRLKDPIRSHVYGKVSALVCQTDEAAAYFSEHVRKHVILNPVKPDLPAPWTGGRRDTVVTFCRLEPQKNLGMLVRAFAQFHSNHPSYTLEIYGDGSERGSMVALVTSLGLESSITVRGPSPRVHEYARDCAMFVLPSDYEGLSNSMIEAMALGLPTISTDCPCGGARMLIDSGQNGILVPVGATAVLAEAMAAVADDTKFARKIGVAATAIRQRLALGRIADEWAAVMFKDLE